MTASRRNKLAAVAVFTLIAAVMCGGIAWATIASLELTRNNILAEHDRHVREAASKIDAYINGVLNAETAREYKEYRSQYWSQAVAVFSREGTERDATVLLPSPLASQPPLQDWIDVYFQVNPDGLASSPQIPMEGMVTLPSGVRKLAGCDPRACRTWAWFTSQALPMIDFDSLGEESGNVTDDGVAAGPNPENTAISRQGSIHYKKLSDQLGAKLSALDYRNRKKSYERAQVSHLPPHECVPQHIADANILEDGETRVRGFVAITSYPVTDVEVRTGRFADPFWLEPEPEDGPKLAFVRKVFHDDEVFYQGFIGDWDRLAGALVEQVKDLFPQAQVRPATSEQRSDTRLVNLPVELVVPDVSQEAMAAAWSSIGGTLIATWLVALVVLTVAGLGLRNLVALTERRMRFAYAVTHELRTPLTTFRLYTDMLSAGLVPDASRQEYLDTLNRESQRLSNLVEDVLEYARLENHRVQLTPVETDGGSLLRSIIEAHEKRIAACGISARTENTISNGQSICTDVDVVSRIASVLINNACRHAATEDKGSLLLRLGAENGHTHLDVIDSGPGIDRADANQIFKPFRRGHAVDKAAHGGIGLGLALARSWANMLGGRLDLVARHHPQLGGAHFRLTFPTQTKTQT